ncbi:ComEC/Rec2 family competence protein [Clostridium sp. P21]|uniref:ComEC/Rec2 family competence protein n=1 Tax=Clostridium muellerianum TaxID=2716538 RepID=A0A7Y0EEL5_9CLOT|nr:ComEC/Rec2 family competence protein [Clostridium muellerianum]NMM61963.1 ComEC/Rec2 family competence protein [Clostridium muellerianum]
MKKPLVYYAISLFIGCLSALMLFKSVIAGAVITASLFVILFLNIDRKFFYINIAFFFTGVLSFMMYFYIQVPENVNVRIIERKGYYYLANYKGRKLILKGNIAKFQEGEKISAHGKLQKEMDLERGIVGVYKIKNYKCCKKDWIFYLYEIKRNIYLQLRQSLGEDKAAIIMSLCYGDTQYLSKDSKSEFQKLGVIHAVSVSGFHIAIIYKVMEKIVGLKLAILVSFVYVLFTGLQPATIRSFVMILIFKLSKILFKNYDSISSLSLAALILLLIKPYYITDIGFMLSFLATLGILLYYKKISRVLYKIPQKLNESLSVTLSSQIFSVPYIAFTIKSFSPGFIIGNLLLLPMYSIIVILGNLVLLVCGSKIMFEFMCKILNFIMIALDGANYLILKTCPEVTNLTYLDGIVLTLIFISCLLYKHGYRKYKYMPFLLLIPMVFQNYDFIPKIYYINFQNAEAVIVKYKRESTMICNYDERYVKDIINLKEQMNVNKVINTIEGSRIVKLNNKLYIKTMPCYKNDSINVCIYNGKCKFALLSHECQKHDRAILKYYNKVEFLPGHLKDNGKYSGYRNEEKYTLYAIIFNGIYKVN